MKQVNLEDCLRIFEKLSIDIMKNNYITTKDMLESAIKDLKNLEPTGLGYDSQGNKLHIGDRCKFLLNITRDLTDLKMLKMFDIPVINKDNNKCILLEGIVRYCDTDDKYVFEIQGNYSNYCPELYIDLDSISDIKKESKENIKVIDEKQKIAEYIYKGKDFSFYRGEDEAIRIVKDKSSELELPQVKTIPYDAMINEINTIRSLISERGIDADILVDFPYTDDDYER